MSGESTLRKVPTQARSRERVERLLDAAEQEFALLGYEAATTEGIAQRAETSIGSLYQFFPNKRALFDALAARYLEQVRTQFLALDALRLEKLPWRDLLRALVDAFWAFNFTTPGFRAIWVQGAVTHDLMEAAARLNRELSGHIEALIRPYTPGLAPKRRALAAQVVVETFSAMLYFAGRQEEGMRDDIRAETLVLLERYLAGYAEVVTSPSRRRRSPRR